MQGPAGVRANHVHPEPKRAMKPLQAVVQRFCPHIPATDIAGCAAVVVAMAPGMAAMFPAGAH